MAYKQTPGRSPFLKTGRDIPLNMISPLHKEKKEISEADIKNMPGYHDPGGDVGITSFSTEEMNKANEGLSKAISSSTQLDRFANYTNFPGSAGTGGGIFSTEHIAAIKKGGGGYNEQATAGMKHNDIRAWEKVIKRGTKGIVPS